MILQETQQCSCDTFVQHATEREQIDIRNLPFLTKMTVGANRIKRAFQMFWNYLGQSHSHLHFSMFLS